MLCASERSAPLPSPPGRPLKIALNHILEPNPLPLLFGAKTQQRQISWILQKMHVFTTEPIASETCRQPICCVFLFQRLLATYNAPGSAVSAVSSPFMHEGRD